MGSKAAIEARYLALLRLELAQQLGSVVRVRLVLPGVQAGLADSLRAVDSAQACGDNAGERQCLELEPRSA